jgi:Domain of unknown function (DUF4331)
MRVPNRNSVCALGGLLGLTALAGCSGSSNNGPATFTQIDRLARPAVNEVFATVANNRHQVNDTDNPTDDNAQLANDIQLFMTHTAGRSSAITNAVKSVLVPDVMVVDLSQVTTHAAYLGVETGGVTGSKFGGRALSDDVVDTSLGVIFGNTIPALGLAPDDGAEIAALTKDNVSATTAPKHFQDGSSGFGAAQFPYLGAPQ